jgi:5-methylcytosine-specific restriction endonuclease McrA
MTCRECGTVILRTPPSARRRFCFRRCAAKQQARATKKLRRLCANCGKPAPFANQKSCSAKCAYLLRKLKTRRPKTCSVCGVEYFPGGRLGVKFCSRVCQRKAQRVDAYVERVCAHCGKSFSRVRLRTRRRKHYFCTRECSLAFHVGERSAIWRGGSDPNRGNGWTKLAASIRRLDRYECQRCGRTQAENGVALSVDHIRPWRSFKSKADANDPSNLVSLCKSCHSWKTTTAERLWLRGDVLDFQKYERHMREAISRRAAAA